MTFYMIKHALHQCTKSRNTVYLKSLVGVRKFVEPIKIQQRRHKVSLEKSIVEDCDILQNDDKKKSDFQSSEMFLNLALVGPPGSGKGTYGSLLAKKLDCKLVTVSDILRNHIEHKTEIGNQVELCQHEGRLADDYLVSKAVISHLLDHNVIQNDKKCQNGQQFINQKYIANKEKKTKRVGFILDGFPRTLQQIQYMEGKDDFWPKEMRVHKIINVDVPDEICLSKMLGRRFCIKCKTNYNTNNVDNNGFLMPPQLPEPPCNCDKSVTWIEREDDTEAIITRRLAEYHIETKKVVSYYKLHGRHLSFVPYNGILDMFKLEKIVEKLLLT